MPGSDRREDVETPSRESEDAVETERLRLGQMSGGRVRVGDMEGSSGFVVVVVVVVVAAMVLFWVESGAEEG